MPDRHTAHFESIKLTNEHGAEYWGARDVQFLLGNTGKKAGTD